MSIDDNTKLEVLHDHYKESFLHIREREKQRDRLFMFVIALIGVLFLEIQYSDMFSMILGNVKLEFIELNISIMPISVFLSVTWTYLFVIVLKYCQTAIFIERQYDYLHHLENNISKLFGHQDIYCREGKAYLNRYPLFSNLVWIFYILLFPIIVILSVGLIIYIEGYKIKAPLYHLIYDSILTIGIAASFILYRLYPLANEKLLKIRNKVVKNRNV
jgi:hypothetical protein